MASIIRESINRTKPLEGACERLESNMPVAESWLRLREPWLVCGRTEEATAVLALGKRQDLAGATIEGFREPLASAAARESLNAPASGNECESIHTAASTAAFLAD